MTAAYFFGAAGRDTEVAARKGFTLA